eukprot:1876449-Amphidinium_carterae.1
MVQDHNDMQAAHARLRKCRISMQRLPMKHTFQFTLRMPQHCGIAIAGNLGKWALPAGGPHMLLADVSDNKTTADITSAPKAPNCYKNSTRSETMRVSNDVNLTSGTARDSLARNSGTATWKHASSSYKVDRWRINTRKCCLPSCARFHIRHPSSATNPKIVGCQVCPCMPLSLFSQAQNARFGALGLVQSRQKRLVSVPSTSMQTLQSYPASLLWAFVFSLDSMSSKDRSASNCSA